jgi:hypothetical protein
VKLVRKTGRLKGRVKKRSARLWVEPADGAGGALACGKLKRSFLIKTIDHRVNMQ